MPAALVLVVAACGSREPPLDQYNAVGLLERGIGSYQEGEFDDAIRFLDRFVLEYPTHARVQEARYYLADSYFEREEYIAAAARFDRLASDFPQGELADDARFKVCDSYRRLSPEPTLDQEYTHAAIDHCRTLALYHPSSEYAARAQEIVDRLEDKLARKQLLVAEHYFDRNAFDSAIIYFQSVVDRYPTTATAPRALLRLAETYDEIGYDEEAMQTRQRLEREYPDSKEARSIGGGTSMAGTDPGA